MTFYNPTLEDNILAIVNSNKTTITKPLELIGTTSEFVDRD